MNLITHPDANAEKDIAADWYEQRSSGLGFDFLAAVRAAFVRVRQNPQLYSPADDAPAGYEVRDIPIDRFPYRVVYWVRPADIVVLAIAHTARRPGYWLRRMNSP